MRGLSKGLAALAAGMLLLGVPALHAQGVEFGIGGGVGIPLSDYDDSAEFGWHGLAELSFVPEGWPIGFQFDGSYQQFSFDEDQFIGVEGLKERFIMGTGNIVFKFKTSEESTFRPYLIGGVGAYNHKLTASDDPGEILDEGQTDFGLNVGAGFDIKAGGAGLFIEGRFHNVYTGGEGDTDPDRQFIPITLGIRFGGN